MNNTDPVIILSNKMTKVDKSYTSFYSFLSLHIIIKLLLSFIQKYAFCNYGRDDVHVFYYILTWHFRVPLMFIITYVIHNYMFFINKHIAYKHSKAQIYSIFWVEKSKTHEI